MNTAGRSASEKKDSHEDSRFQDIRLLKISERTGKVEAGAVTGGNMTCHFPRLC